MEQTDITALGEALIDFTCQSVNGRGQRVFTQNPGGAPANVVVAASRLGSRTAFFGKVGDDMHGRFLKEVLEQENVDTYGLRLDGNFFTTLAFVDIAPNGERTFSFARKPGADTQLSRGEVDPEHLWNSTIFHVGALSLTDEPSRDATIFALRTAKSADVLISYDPNYRAALWPDEETAREQMRSVIPYADLMKLSDEETELLTDRCDPEGAAEELIRQGVSVVVVTLGGEGAYVRTAEGGRRVPGFPCHAVDTTGAGDAFWGAFLHKISVSGCRPEQLALEEIADFARFANAAASLCVEREGAIPAMPRMEEALARLNA